MFKNFYILFSLTLISSSLFAMEVDAEAEIRSTVISLSEHVNELFRGALIPATFVKSYDILPLSPALISYAHGKAKGKGKAHQHKLVKESLRKLRLLIEQKQIQANELYEKAVEALSMQILDPEEFFSLFSPPGTADSIDMRSFKIAMPKDASEPTTSTRIAAIPPLVLSSVEEIAVSQTPFDAYSTIGTWVTAPAEFMPSLDPRDARASTSSPVQAAKLAPIQSVSFAENAQRLARNELTIDQFILIHPEPPASDNTHLILSFEDYLQTLTELFTGETPVDVFLASMGVTESHRALRTLLATHSSNNGEKECEGRRSDLVPDADPSTFTLANGVSNVDDNYDLMRRFEDSYNDEAIFYGALPQDPFPQGNNSDRKHQP